MSSIPGQGTKIPHVAQHSQKNKIHIEYLIHASPGVKTVEKIIYDYNLVRGNGQTTSQLVRCIMQQEVTGVIKKKESRERKTTGGGRSQSSLGLGAKAPRAFEQAAKRSRGNVMWTSGQGRSRWREQKGFETGICLWRLGNNTGSGCLDQSEWKGSSRKWGQKERRSDCREGAEALGRNLASNLSNMGVTGEFWAKQRHNLISVWQAGRGHCSR